MDFESKTLFNNFNETQFSSQSTPQVCSKCFTPLSLYQLNFDEALKICANPQCLLTPRSNEIVQRAFTQCPAVAEKFDSFNTEEKYIESDQLNFVLNFDLANELKKLDSLISNYQQQRNQGEILFEPQQGDFVLDPFQSDHGFSVSNSASEATLNQDVPMNEEQTPLLFDDNFFSDLANLLDNDIENSTQIHECLVEPSTKKSFKSFLTDQHDETMVFADLQPIKQEELASQMANELLETDFVNVHTSPEIIGTFSQSKSTGSSISINKNDNRPKPDIKISNLKLIDEKDDLLALIDSAKSSKPDRKEEGRQPVKKSTQGLLPWEVKSKRDCRPKPKVDSRSHEKAKIKDESKIPRVDSRSNLSLNINELSSVLKQKKLLNENTFTVNSSPKKALNFNDLKATAPTSGGYKDLVLSVLKKKTTTTS